MVLIAPNTIEAFPTACFTFSGLDPEEESSAPQPCKILLDSCRSTNVVVRVYEASSGVLFIAVLRVHVSLYVRTYAPTLRGLHRGLECGMTSAEMERMPHIDSDATDANSIRMAVSAGLFVFATWRQKFESAINLC